MTTQHGRTRTDTYYCSLLFYVSVVHIYIPDHFIPEQQSMQMLICVWDLCVSL